MHELSYMVRLCETALATIDENQVSRVSKMVVSVGEMTGVLPEYLHRYFPQTVKGTILEGAELEVICVPVLAECGGCGRAYHPSKDNGYVCPFCGNKSGRVIAGRDVVLDRLEIQ